MDVDKLIVLKGLPDRLTRSPTAKSASTPALCSAWEKWEMLLLPPGRSKLKWYSEKQSLQGYESNLRNADGVRVVKFPRNRNIGALREDYKV